MSFIIILAIILFFVSMAWILSKPSILKGDKLMNELKAEKSDGTNEVVITDIRMQFGSMVIFMVKWAIASIPALIIIFMIWMMVMGVFGVGIATLFK